MQRHGKIQFGFFISTSRTNRQRNWHRHDGSGKAYNSRVFLIFVIDMILFPRKDTIFSKYGSKFLHHSSNFFSVKPPGGEYWIGTKPTNYICLYNGTTIISVKVSNFLDITKEKILIAVGGGILPC